MKAQGLPLNFIVGALILLVVMLIVIFLFKGKVGDVSSSMSSCLQQGGECMASKDCSDSGGRLSLFLKCDQEDTQCCMGGS
jgi:hypothetical protein